MHILYYECDPNTTIITPRLLPVKHIKLTWGAFNLECNIEANKVDCGCTYEICERKGKCCECIVYHKKRGGLPGCLFPPEVERTYDRSFKRFIDAMK
jgi:hypothetical protein